MTPVVFTAVWPRTLCSNCVASVGSNSERLWSDRRIFFPCAETQISAVSITMKTEQEVKSHKSLLCCSMESTRAAYCSTKMQVLLPTTNQLYWSQVKTPKSYSTTFLFFFPPVFRGGWPCVMLKGSFNGFKGFNGCNFSVFSHWSHHYCFQQKALWKPTVQYCPEPNSRHTHLILNASVALCLLQVFANTYAKLIMSLLLLLVSHH